MLGLFFVATGIVHFVVPDGLPDQVSWMYDLSDTTHAIAGTAEILGGLGLIVPSLVGTGRSLTVVAAAGLTLLMIGAAGWHLIRGEYPQAVGNVVVAWVAATLAMNEWRSRPR
jgi:uncharacterized membrane protein